jgi:hypothetical protein
MDRKINFLTRFGEIRRKFAWASLQDDGAISVGLIDKSEPKIPHFTFHPSAYYHFRQGKQDEVFAGIFMPDLVVEAEGRFKWVEITSKMVSRLDLCGSPPVRGDVDSIEIPLSSEDISVALFVDFIKSDEHRYKNCRVLDWKGRKIEFGMQVVRAQEKPSFWWNNES